MLVVVSNTVGAWVLLVIVLVGLVVVGMMVVGMEHVGHSEKGLFICWEMPGHILVQGLEAVDT